MAEFDDPEKPLPHASGVGRGVVTKPNQVERGIARSWCVGGAITEYGAANMLASYRERILRELQECLDKSPGLEVDDGRDAVYDGLWGGEIEAFIARMRGEP